MGQGRDRRVALGRITGSRKTSAVGGDHLRAQFVSQVVVQGVKFATRRRRPDGSNTHSFPSGRRPGAEVALEHGGGGKRAGGVAVGIAAGRTVTLGVGGAMFDIGVAPDEGWSRCDVHPALAVEFNHFASRHHPLA